MIVGLGGGMGVTGDLLVCSSYCLNDAAESDCLIML